MITDGFLFISLLIAIAAILVYLDKARGLPVFRYVPGFVFLYLIAALLNTVGVFGESDSIDAVGGGVKDALLPAMIMLLLFQCDVRKIIKLGPKLLLTYAATAVSIMLGFVITFAVLKGGSRCRSVEGSGSARSFVDRRFGEHGGRAGNPQPAGEHLRPRSHRRHHRVLRVAAGDVLVRRHL